MHSGHRNRLRDKFLQNDGEGLCDHELLELLLFYSIPRVNTNTQAHMLLKRYGSLRAVLDANIPELKRVDGVGDNSAMLIRLISAIMARCSKEENDRRAKMNKLSVTGEYIAGLFDGAEESLYLILLDNSLRLTEAKCIMSGTVNYSASTVSAIVREAVFNNAPNVILAHNHPPGIAVPSSQDITATQTINQALKYVQIKLIEHFVVSGDRCNTIMHTDDREKE